MKKKLKYLLFFMLPFLPCLPYAQGIYAVDDFIALSYGQSLNYNVTDNDSIPSGWPLPVIFFIPDSTCFSGESNGQLFFSGSPECCGQHFLSYIYDDCAFNVCSANVVVTVLCKPDCYLVNLDALPPGGNGGQECAYACENSEAIYYVSYNPANTYLWSVSGGAFVQGVNPAEIRVSWGPKGSGTIFLTIVKSNGETTVRPVCVEILEGPVAGFEAPDSVCREEPVAFRNTSMGGDGYFWDFGDGQTSTMFEPTHAYTAPGTYTVCLIVTRQNYKSEQTPTITTPIANDGAEVAQQQQPGIPLCCCTDTICMEIVVEPLQAPNIYCVSTLCANDSTEYWTDAANCSAYFWSVRDENGAPRPFSGQGTDRIAVHWGAGPAGTVSLYVEGCDDLYCEDTVTVTVPILSATTAINGPAVVCSNEAVTYTVQKWISAYYNWEVVNGTILSGQGTHAVVVLWDFGGNGTISVTYYSDFLGGLPGHDPADCTGNASLSVEIRPRFEIFGSSLVCIENTSSFSASSLTGYTWSIDPPAAFTGQGTNNILVTWGGAGTYTIKAVPADPALFCNPEAIKSTYVSKLPKPVKIEGPTEICPGATYTYIGKTSESGVGFDWTVTGGTASYYNGYSIEVTWSTTGPYRLVLNQSLLSHPFCTSDTIQLDLNPKVLNGPLTITGPVACINTLKNYSASPAQHPEAQYTWSVSPPYLGSVASGQGTPDVVIQWNNDTGAADLMLTVELCDSVISTTRTINVVAPVEPVITGGPFCAGSPVVLDAGAGFSSYQWSPGGETTQTITVSANGIYAVTTTDSDGCAASDTYNAVASPVARIVSPEGSLRVICLTSPSAVALTAQNGPGYTFEWYCDGVPAGNAVTLVHTNTGVPGSFNYWVVVTDSAGCTATSNTVEIRQIDCTGSGSGGGACTPQPYSLSFTAANRTPDCNIVDFTAAASSNVTLLGWDFDDPNNNLNTGTLTNATHAYTTAGLHQVVLLASVPELSGGGFCLVGEVQDVNVPLVANFKSSYVCETVTFTDLSAIAPTSWLWSFGDGGTSTLQNPVHEYPAPGTYSVTLTVSDGVCEATIVKQVTAGGAATPVITAVPSPYCVNKPIRFANSDAGIVAWFWDFDDLAENASVSPFHTYVNDGSYNVGLTVTDAEGCKDSVILPLTVNPLPPEEVIAAAPGLTVCDGASVTLTAPSGMGYAYLWSTAETTQSIVVTTPGKYTVTITDSGGCTMTPEAVEVVMLPLPPATISGSHFICGSGCIALRVPLGAAYSYQWYDMAGPMPGENAPSLSVCDFNLASPYKVEITDGNTMCSAVSAPFDVSVVSSPSFTILNSPDDCEGVPVTLKVDPVQANVIYAWSNGASGVFTIVEQAGTYRAVGRDTTTGCQGVAAAIIHPLPDLCLVPVGCYEVCDPDTICGPDNLAAYQWNRNGMPIPGETGQCLIVTENGDYSLTGATFDGCSMTTDTLRLKTVNCTCAGLSATLDAVTTPDGCCWSAAYSNPFDDKFKLVIRSDDTDFVFDVGSLDPSLQATAVLPGSITLESSVAGAPLPMGALDDFLTFCLTNELNNAPQIVFDWYGDAAMVACSDTVGLATDYTESISCPPNITVTAPGGSGAAIVNYPLPTATSDCPCPGIALELTAGLPSGSAFPVGNTLVCFRATDSCAISLTCCFTVEVSGAETACDVKTIGCVKYELLTITQNAALEKTYRIRVTNNCPDKLSYTAIQLPNGLKATEPADNSLYTAPGGRQYLVRNPNASPFYSIRFRSTTDSIAGGASDIFQYTLPAQAAPTFIHLTSRLEPQAYYEAHLNTFGCPIGATPQPKPAAGYFLRVFPNPTGGVLYADLSAWKGREVRLRVLNSHGQEVMEAALTADAAPQPLVLPERLTSGLYALDVLTTEGERAVVRFVLER